MQEVGYQIHVRLVADAITWPWSAFTGGIIPIKQPKIYLKPWLPSLRQMSKIQIYMLVQGLTHMSPMTQVSLSI